MKIMNLNRKGFTYIEILVGVVILSAIALGFSRLFISNMKLTKSNQFKAFAYRSASDDVEYVKTLHYASINNDTKDLLFNNIKTFTVTRSVTELNMNKLKQVDITVSWIEDGVSRNVSLSTLIANY